MGPASLSSALAGTPVVARTRLESCSRGVSRASCMRPKTCSSESQSEGNVSMPRRSAMLALTAGTLGAAASPREAVAVGRGSAPVGFKKDFTQRYKEVPEEDFKDLGGGLKYYVVKPGSGGGMAKKGDRVAVHFDVKRKDGKLTVATSRQGAGVTGGTPYGFEVGRFGGPGGPFIKGMDIGTEGMVVGELRRLIVPPSFGYGNKQVQEIPANATLKVDIELLSIAKTTPFG